MAERVVNMAASLSISQAEDDLRRFSQTTTSKVLQWSRKENNIYCIYIYVPIELHLYGGKCLAVVRRSEENEDTGWSNITTGVCRIASLNAQHLQP